jgi:hypothetical protein
MTITKRRFATVRPERLNAVVMEFRERATQPRLAAIAAVEAGRIDFLIRRYAKLRDLGGLWRGRTTLSE